MITIDKGEKHLFKRRLLDTEGNAIAWSKVTNITFELFLFGERSVKTWSKTLGTVLDADPYTEFELDSTTYRTGDYYIKATLITDDNTWSDGTAQEITWETTKIVISDELSTFNESESTADIQFDVVEKVDPTISDFNLTLSVTDSDYTIDFTKATDNSDDTTLEYILVEGVLADVEDSTVIESLTQVDSGTDINTFTISREQGFTSYVNVYVKDEAGNIALYNPALVEVLDPEIIGIDITPNSIDGIAGDTGSISWVVESEDTTSAQELATPTSSDDSRLLLSNIDKSAGTADYELLDQGIGSVSVTSDFDNFTAEIPFDVSGLELLGNTKSTTVTFDKVSA